jgi:histidinol-phosphate/aromatic aminotransferase/cobyric acid decarboxylase-like protein
MNFPGISRDSGHVAPCEHGGVVLAELTALGIRPQDVADFSVNTNPYGPAQVVLDAVRSARIDAYPDPRAWQARLAIAGATDTAAECVCLGNGAAELLWTLARALLRPGDPVLIVAPTFSEFERAARAQRAVSHEWRASMVGEFCVSLPDVGARLAETGAKVLYVSSPNTPTGAAIDLGELGALAAERDSRALAHQGPSRARSPRWLPACPAAARGCSRNRAARLVEQRCGSSRRAEYRSNSRVR